MTPNSLEWIYSFVKDQGKKKKPRRGGHQNINNAYVKQQDY